MKNVTQRTLTVPLDLDKLVLREVARRKRLGLKGNYSRVLTAWALAGAQNNKGV